MIIVNVKSFVIPANAQNPESRIQSSIVQIPCQARNDKNMGTEWQKTAGRNDRGATECPGVWITFSL